jgi:periplasmic divalent cation tolerance protein
MENGYLIIFVTTPSVNDARKIGQMLVSEQLAACVNILPEMTSIYTWEAEICEESEVLLFIKTRAALFDVVSARIVEEHPYAVPEVIAVPVTAGAEGYLRWIDDVTRQV